MHKNEYNLFLSTLSNNKRVKIINLLRNGSKSVTHIYKNLKFNQTTVSRHLGCLEKCKFVTVKKNGKQRIYTLNKSTIVPLMKIIDRHIDKYCPDMCKCKEVAK